MYFYKTFQMKIIYLSIILLFFVCCKEKEEIKNKLITSKNDCIVPNSDTNDSLFISQIEDGVTVVEIKQKR